MEIIVMSLTGIQLDTAEHEDGTGGNMPFRWRGNISVNEYNAICQMDQDAGRSLRLEAIEAPKKRGRKKADAV